MKQHFLYVEDYWQCLVLKGSVIIHLVRTDNLRLTIKQTLGQQPCLKLAGTPSVKTWSDTESTLWKPPHPAIIEGCTKLLRLLNVQELELNWIIAHREKKDERERERERELFSSDTTINKMMLAARERERERSTPSEQCKLHGSGEGKKNKPLQLRL